MAGRLQTGREAEPRRPGCAVIAYSNRIFLGLPATSGEASPNPFHQLRQSDGFLNPTTRVSSRYPRRPLYWPDALSKSAGRRVRGRPAALSIVISRPAQSPAAPWSASASARIARLISGDRLGHILISAATASSTLPLASEHRSTAALFAARRPRGGSSGAQNICIAIARSRLASISPRRGWNPLVPTLPSQPDEFPSELQGVIGMKLAPICPGARVGVGMTFSSLRTGVDGKVRGDKPLCCRDLHRLQTIVLIPSPHHGARFIAASLTVVGFTGRLQRAYPAGVVSVSPESRQRTLGQPEQGNRCTPRGLDEPWRTGSG